MNIFNKNSLITFLIFGLLFSGRRLQAHAELIEANPALGALLNQSPEQIVLMFDEPLGAGSDIFVFTEGFQYIDNIQVSIGGDENKQLMATLPPLADNEYNVQWAVISVDGHSISGTYAFQVETPTANNLFTWLVGSLVVGFMVIGVVFWRNKGYYETTSDGI